jgi:hypothetical protein
MVHVVDAKEIERSFIQKMTFILCQRKGKFPLAKNKKIEFQKFRRKSLHTVPKKEFILGRSAASSPNKRQECTHHVDGNSQAIST